MRILYVGSVDVSLQKGDTTHFMQLACALLKRAHELTIVALGDSKPENISNIETHLVQTNTTSRVGSFINDLKLNAKAIQVARSREFDLLYYRGVSFLANCGHFLGLPSISEVNGIYVDELRSAGMRRLGLQFHTFREKNIVTGADRIICVTEGIRNELVKQYGVKSEQCYVIGNAADLELFYPKSKSECRNKLGLRLDSYNIGFIGTFQPWIEFKPLFEAITELVRQKVPVLLTLVGDGPKFNDVKQCVRNHNLDSQVLLTGRVPYETIPDWINTFDVCIAPFARSRNQKIGLSPLKLYEYMACGRPAIVSDIPGVTATIKSANAGLIYDSANAVTLASHLLQIYEKPDLGELMGRNARNYVHDNHSWESVAERTEQIMNQLLKQK
jgi:glycosyltransferase involved in cell wall biosynthesis